MSSNRGSRGTFDKNTKKHESQRVAQRSEGDAIDETYGFHPLKEGSQLGWLLNYLPISQPDEKGVEKSGMNLYFIDKLGKNFKATLFHQPYFYVEFKEEDKRTLELSHFLQRKYENYSLKVDVVEREDLDLPNHISGKKRTCLKLSFDTVNDLMDVRNSLKVVIAANQKKNKENSGNDIDNMGHVNGGFNNSGLVAASASDPLSYLTEMKEYDVPYTMRASIDLDLRVGAWYVVEAVQGTEECTVTWQKDLIEKCNPKVLAFDIECEKSPLKFPNPDRDRIYMISYMISGGPGEPPQGYLIISKEIVSEDIDNFEYTPLPKFPGPFHVFNEQNEEGLMRRFVDHVKELKPHVMVTYNGDGFDWPYVEARAKLFNLSVYKEFGMKSASGSGGESKVLASDNEYLGRCVVHLDAFKWVQRDSYLPQGNQGLKSVTKAKLGYDPVEVDPEDMVRYAIEKPAHMASYSVSDAVATYYLYQLYVHNFIFSLCTILPMQSEDVLRKGSGTLCEALLMVEAYRLNIMCPNKQMDNLEKFHNGHLLESETYIGGHVECIEAGVFRSDIPVQFKIVPSAVQSLIDNIDRDLTFAIETENGMQRSDVVNYDDVKQEIVEKLEELRDSPNRNETPFIYHLDVGAMYPNIILTNRLQPSAIVTPSDCASCEYNRAENNCKRPMTWTWRGDYIPASIGEYQNIKRQLTFERFPVEPDQIGYKSNGATTKSFSELSEKAQATKIKERLKTYSQRVYRKSKITEVSERVDTVCMRENPFYVNTVRSFRDRRYDYKLLTKQWKGKKAAAEKSGDVLSKRQAEDMEILMDSLQLAHKCILNSFYGYVMRKGARWRSMEMAGLVTHTGAGLIKQARELVEQIGRPLELDTDGIWAAIPSSFPSDFKLLLRNGGKINFAYPCAMLNADVHDQYTNSQYQNLIVDSEGNSGSGAAKQFATHAECSIYFELDGPYKAMILPASPEEGRLLKKKYVVFNYDNSVAELKGFEIKRRGELEMVKIFQSQVFDKFLAGKTLQDSYDAVGAVANKWLDILDTCGMNVPVDEMLELISEKKTISKTLDDYSGRKATSLTTATRLADFLGAEMAKDKGLNCNLIISKYPRNAPVTDRAIPVAIFAAEESVRKYYLRKWLKEPHLECEDFREVVDWDYYKERISRTIQKIITVPAGIQSIQNPCPRVEHPPWLQKILSDKLSKTKQVRINTLFKPGMIDKQPKHVVGSLGTSESQSMVDSPTKKRVFSHSSAVMDIEDLMDPNASLGLNKSKTVLSRHKVKFSGDEYIATEGNADDGCGTLSNAEADMDTGGDDEHSPSADANEKDMMDVESTVSPMMIQAPSTKEEMLAWLNTRKAQWKKERDLLKQARGLRNGSGQGKQYGKSIKDVLRGSGAVGYYNENDASKNKRVMSVADLVRNATLSVTQGYWQIIELCPSETPGEFIVYAMTQRAQMQKLFLTVPRYMYFNCRKSDAADFAKALGGRNVVKDLPHSHKIGSCGLYEIALSERKFIRNDKQLSSLSNSSSVEGVYETLTPLWLRSVLQIGCITRLSNGHSSTSSSTHFNLEDLEFISSKDFPYMNIRTAQYRKIYLYAITEKTKNSNPLGGIGLFILDDLYEDVDTEAFDTAKISGKAYVWLINTGLTSYAAQQQPRPPMHKIYRKHYAAQHYSNGHLGNPFANNEDMKFNTRFVNSVSDAWQMCSEKLENYMRERHGPTVVFVQGSVGDINTKSWRKICPVLHDMPVVLMPHNSTDEYFPLTWQMFVAERMIQRLFILPTWLEDRLQSANYCHVPLANLGRDVTMTMIDVLFARQLKHNKHVLWCSEKTNSGSSNIIDCGGGTNDVEEYQLQAVWSDSLKEPIINTPGIYNRDMCIELEMSHVAVNAIVISQLLDSEGIYSAQSSSAAGIMDGTFGMFGKQNSKPSHSSESTVNSTTITNSAPTDASCGRAFVLLKALVTKWLYDYKHLNDYHAYSLLNNCYRYLCGGSGNNTLLSDPALHRIVYGLMIKLFKCLMVELKKLNVVIVYASFNKIIISATNKHDIPAAEEYISFIIDTLMRKEMFQNLNLKVKSCWNQLVWYDINNWCGGKYVFPQPIEEEVEVSEGDHDTNPMDGLVPESVIEEEHSETLPLGKPRKRRQKSLDSVRGESEDDEAAEDPSSAEHADGADDMAIDGDADSALPSKEDKYKNSQLFSMWAKQSEKNLGGEEGVSVVHTHGSSFVPSVALINPSSQKKKRNKKNKYQEFIQHHPLSDSDDDGVEAAPGEYDFLDSIMGKDSFEENSQSHYSQSRRHYHKPKSITERDYYPDDEVEYDPEEEENELKVYAKPNADRQSLDEDEEGDVEYDDGSIGEGSRHSVHDVEEPMEEEPTGPHFQVEHHWNIISYLPKPVIVYFKYIIEEYMNTFQNKYEGYMISQEKDQTLLGDVTGVSGGEGDELHLHSNPDVDPVHLSILYMCGHVDENTKRIVIDHDTIVRMVQQEMKHVVTVTMLDNMLAIMEQLREVYGPPGSEAARNAFDYSNTTLQHDRSRSKGAKRREEKQKEFNDPVLEFVKVCMHILSLDSHLSDEVATLRRGLLSQLRMREYSPESEFHDVNASYILPDVICSYCNSCRDVDMLSDFKSGRELEMEEGPRGVGSSGGSAVMMVCNQCGHHYDSVFIENKLLAEVSRLNITYLLQDIRCPKTHKISSRLCTSISELCAPLELDISQQTMKAQLLLLYHVATYYNFRLLMEALDLYL